jgi:hypothetical protein
LVKFSSGKLGASHNNEDSDSWLADKTRRMSCPCHLKQRVGPSASSARYFADQNPHIHILHSSCSGCTRSK